MKGYVEEIPCMFVFGLFAVAAEVHREGHGWENSDGEGNSRVASCGTVVVGIKIQQRHNYVLLPPVILLQPTTFMHRW